MADTTTNTTTEYKYGRFMDWWLELIKSIHSNKGCYEALEKVKDALEDICVNQEITGEVLQKMLDVVTETDRVINDVNATKEDYDRVLEQLEIVRIDIEEYLETTYGITNLDEHFDLVGTYENALNNFEKMLDSKEVVDYKNDPTSIAEKRIYVDENDNVFIGVVYKDMIPNVDPETGKGTLTEHVEWYSIDNIAEVYEGDNGNSIKPVFTHLTEKNAPQKQANGYTGLSEVNYNNKRSFMENVMTSLLPHYDKYKDLQKESKEIARILGIKEALYREVNDGRYITICENDKFYCCDTVNKQTFVLEKNGKNIVGYMYNTDNRNNIENNNGEKVLDWNSDENSTKCHTRFDEGFSLNSMLKLDRVKDWFEINGVSRGDMLHNMIKDGQGSFVGVETDEYNDFYQYDVLNRLKAEMDKNSKFEGYSVAYIDNNYGDKRVTYFAFDVPTAGASLTVNVNVDNKGIANISLYEGNIDKEHIVFNGYEQKALSKTRATNKNVLDVRDLVTRVLEEALIENEHLRHNEEQQKKPNAENNKNTKNRKENREQ